MPVSRAEPGRPRGALGVDRVFFPLNGDGKGDLNNSIGAPANIRSAEQRGEPVVVHGAAGSRRSGGVVAVDRVLFDGGSGGRASREMRSFGVERESALPSHGNEDMSRIVEALAERGLLEAIPDPLPPASGAVRPRGGRSLPAPPRLPRLPGPGRGADSG